MMYTMPKNLLSICVNFALATQQISHFCDKIEPVKREKNAGIDSENPQRPHERESKVTDAVTQSNTIGNTAQLKLRRFAVILCPNFVVISR